MSISDWSSDVCSSDLTWLEREGTVLRAYVAGISARLFTQRATAILSADIFALPYPEDEDLDLSQNERIIAEDIIAHQRDFIRLGTAAPVMRVAPAEALDRSEEHTSELQSLMRISYAVFCLKKKIKKHSHKSRNTHCNKASQH